MITINKSYTHPPFNMIIVFDILCRIKYIYRERILILLSSFNERKRGRDVWGEK